MFNMSNYVANHVTDIIITFDPDTSRETSIHLYIDESIHSNQQRMAFFGKDYQTSLNLTIIQTLRNNSIISGLVRCGLFTIPDKFTAKRGGMILINYPASIKDLDEDSQREYKKQFEEENQRMIRESASQTD